MNNRQVGILLFVLTIVIAFIAWSYDDALNKIVNTQCSHGLSCPMYATIDAQRNLAIGLIALLLFSSGVIFFWVPAVQIVKEFITPKVKPKPPPKLEGDDKTVFELLKKNNSSMYQGDILKQTGYSKVKVSRILDSLEKKELIERKRRGMANLVVVK